jgi:fructan beta-fructosidase
MVNFVNREIMKKILPVSILLLSILLTISCKNRTEKSQLSEQHRPKFHFSPDSMWMNDPNGLVYLNGEYHLFYQYYPEGNTWGPMHWGHAVSKDLVKWEHLPIALYPDSLGYIFSGSAVFDKDNTSGLGTTENPPLVAIFTYHNMAFEKAGRQDCQYQGIAYSIDNGRSWTKYQGNPVLPNPGKRDFRDPKVMWHQASQKWIMVLAVNNHVRFYSSPNLKEWSFESAFGEKEGVHEGIWECPDIFPMETPDGEKWVLLVSLNNGAPNGGSGTQYFIGDFNGNTFVNSNKQDKIHWLEYGKDNYASVTWSNIPDSIGQRLIIGWMSNWQYAEKVPTYRWRNAMTLPRTLELKKFKDDLILVTEPINELTSLRKTTSNIQGGIFTGNKLVDHDTSDAFIGELKIIFQEKNGPQFGLASDFGIELSNGLGESVLIGYEPMQKQYFIDRTHSGKTNFSPQFSGKHYAPSSSEGEIISMHLFIDASSVELFADDGRTVMTELYFPNEDFNHIRLFANNGSVKLKTGNVFSFR